MYECIYACFSVVHLWKCSDFSVVFCFSEGLVVGQNYIPSSSRPTALAAAVTVSQSQQMASTQLIGMDIMSLQCQCQADGFLLPVYM